MLVKVCLAFLLIGTGIYSSEFNAPAGGVTIAEFGRSFGIFVRQLARMEVPLDSRLNQIVLPDGRTLVTGTQVRRPTWNLIVGRYDKNAERQASGLLDVIRTTTDTSVHYEALRDLAELAEKGTIDALGGIASLLDPKSDPIRQLPWTHRNGERARWLNEVTRLKEQQLYSKYSEKQKEEAREQLEAMLLRPTVALVAKDGGDLVDAGMRQRNCSDSDSSRSSGNNSIQRLLNSSSDDDDNHKQVEISKNK